MEDVKKRQQTFLFLSKLECSPKEINSREIAHICCFQRIVINAKKLEKTPIHFKSGVFAAVTFVDAKSPYFQPLCRLCVEHVEEVAKESALFVHDERPEQISADITEEVEASSER